MNDLSTLSGIEASRTFTSEFVINPVVTANVKHFGMEAGADEDAQAHASSVASKHTNPTTTTTTTIETATQAQAQAQADDDSDQAIHLDFHGDDLGLAAPSTAINPLVSPRRSTRVRRGPDAATAGSSSTSAGTKDGSGRGKGAPAGGKAAGKGPALKQAHSLDKENAGVSGGAQLGKAGSRRAAAKASAVATAEPWTGRRKPRRPFGDEEGRPPNAFDKFFRWYYNSSRWLVPGIFFVMAWLFVIFLLVQSWGSILDGTPYGGDRAGVYIPPLHEPGNVQELVERLRSLEKNLGAVDSRLQHRFQDGISDLKSALSKASSESATKSEKSAKETDVVLSSLQSQFDSLQRETEKHKKNVAKELKRTQQELERASSHQVPASKQIRDQVAHAVRDALPSTLAATLKPDGTVEISKQFNTALRDLFDTHFPQRFDQKFDQAVKKAKLDVKAAPSWQSFLRDNEDRLKESVEKKVDEAVKSRGDGAVLTPESVMLIVREKMEQYQFELEKTMKPMMDKRLNRYKTMLEMEQNNRLSAFRESIEREQATLVQKAVETASAVANRIASTRPSSGQKASSGPFSAAAPAGAQIPDYANHLTGASVWPYLTSPSYERPGGDQISLSSSLWSRMFPAWSGRYVPHPVTAIMPTQDVGECWPFPGVHGTLAIRLSEKIYPTHITIEHAPKQLALDYTAAPKTVEFWVQIKNTTQRATVESHALRLAELSGKKDATSRLMQTSPTAAVGYSSHGGDFVKLDTVEFDINSGGTQSFEMPVDMTHLGVAINIVAFVVKDNHGNEEFTCLYRAKVHGYTPAGIKGQADMKKEAGKGWW